MSQAPSESHAAHSVSPSFWGLAVAALLGLGSMACQPEIGDECSTSTDCSTSGDRLCDTSQPGGYCTQFNCGAGTCPEDEGICIGFYASTSTLAACRDESAGSRFARSFCMKPCDSDGDCRGGYACIDMRQRPGTAVIEEGSPSGRVCAVPASGLAEQGPDQEPGVCRGNSLEIPVDPYTPTIDAGPTDGGGDASSDGGGDAATDGGGDASTDGGGDASTDGGGDASTDGGDAATDGGDASSDGGDAATDAGDASSDA